MVVAIIAAILGMIVPSVNSMWRESKSAETEQMLTGALAATRAQAYHDKQRGLFFMLDGDVQKIYPIEAEPYDAANPDDAANNVSEESAADRFVISDGKVITLSKPFRVVPRAVVDTGSTAKTWSEDELNRQDYQAPSIDELQRHRNFFTIVFSTDGQLIVDRDVLIHDPDVLPNGSSDDLGDHTGLEVPAGTGAVANWYNGTDPPVAFQPTGAQLIDVIHDPDTSAALNFRSVDGLLVYDDSSFMEQPTADLRRQYLLDTGQPLYVSRLSGVVIRGPLGEND